MRRAILPASLALAGLVTVAAVSQNPAPWLAPPTPEAPVPFTIGERLEYNLKFGLFNVGRGEMQVLGIDTVRGVPCYHILFVIRGHALFYSLHDSLQSWFGVDDLISRRFVQDTDENGRMRYRHYEIFPERRRWVRYDDDDMTTAVDSGETPFDPLDDASFFFFARRIPYEVGQTYSFPRYFRVERNPVTIIALQRQNIGVPAGRFSTIAVRPIFKSKGLFAQGGEAVIWFSDDADHIPVRIRTRLPIGTLEMSLRSRN